LRRAVTNSWIEQPVHFVDFEGSIASGIVEYGVVTIQQGAVITTSTRLCRPSGRLRPEDVAVHGLDEKALADTRPLMDDFAQFTTWRETGPLAAHFAGTENSLLKSAWPYPRTSPDFARPGRTSNEWGPWIDTGSLYRQIYPQLDTYKLADVIAACGLQGELDELATHHCPADRCRYHAAPYDALAGAVLLLSLGRESQLGALSMMQLLALSTLDGGKRDALQQEELWG
jgi:DNA polymerase III epsilon subunit-like protein